MASKATKSRCDRALYERKKSNLLDALGRACVNCGSSENIEFDHVDRSEKSFSILTEWKRPLHELLEEVKKCQPLCATCHADKTRVELSVEHGGGLSGKRNCKCPLCKNRKAEYTRARNSSSARVPPIERLMKLHGTRAGYLIEKRLGVHHCAPCKKANAEYSKSLRTKASLV